MAYNYIVTAHKPTAVSACVAGNFTSANELNLIVAKRNYLEIYLATSEGLKILKEEFLYGKIAVLKLFRPKNGNKDFLFIVTKRYDIMILDCIQDANILKIVTKAYGNVSDRFCEPYKSGILAVIDPEFQVIVLRIYHGVLKFIQLNHNYSQFREYNIRCENRVKYVEFLHGCHKPTLVLIHKDRKGRYINIREISFCDRKLMEFPSLQNNVKIEKANTILIPIHSNPYGVLIIGQEAILYYNGNPTMRVVPSILKNSSLVCYTKVDASGLRYLLGDMEGYLFHLFLIVEENDDAICVKDIEVNLLGKISIPECITYLDNGFVFIGSRLGDSQLIKLNLTSDKKCFYVTLMESFKNLGPIVDMCVVDFENRGQGQLVTCSGSLNIIRNGISIQEHASIDLAGIKGMWALQVASSDKLDNTLVLSFVGQTRVLSITGEEVEETEIQGFTSVQQTFFCGNVTHDQIVQVTSVSARLISTQSKQLLAEWKPPTEKNISVVACNTTQIVCSTGSDLYYLIILPRDFIQLKHTTLDYEVACLDVSPLTEGAIKADFVAVGLWTDISICILKLSDFTQVMKQLLGGEIIPRSVLITCFEQRNYLLCTLGDGSMFYFSLDRKTGTLTDKKKITLGTQPTILHSFRTFSKTNVFACSDWPIIIYSSNNNLVFSDVNMNKVNCMCSVNTEVYSDCLALATDSTVTIGTIDEIQKLYVRTIASVESPKKIAYQESTKGIAIFAAIFNSVKHGIKNTYTVVSSLLSSVTETFGVLSVSTISIEKQIPVLLDQSKASTSNASIPLPEYAEEIEIHNVLIIDQHTFEIISSCQLLKSEYALSIVSCSLGEDPNTYYIIGTALMDDQQLEPKKGRILMCKWKDNSFRCIFKKKIPGACYFLSEFNGKLLAIINNTVRLFEWTQEKELRLKCSHCKFITALHLKTKGDFILLGDLMRSMTLLQYKTMENSFEVIVQDFNPNWMSAVEILDDDMFLGAEETGNLFVCQKDSDNDDLSSLDSDDDDDEDDEEEEELQKMETIGRFHIGDRINVFRNGSLVRQNLTETSAPTSGCVLFGTVSGAIGLVTQLPKSFYDFLHQLQTRLTSTIKSLGFIEHRHWRSFHTQYKTEPSEGFIDGDLIESFLNLSLEKMKEIVEGLQLEQDGMKQNCTVDDVVEIITDLKRIYTNTSLCDVTYCVEKKIGE